MPTDSQTLLIYAAAAFLLPTLAGWALAHHLRRGTAAFLVAAVAGIGAGLWLGPKAGLLATVWSLGFAYLGSSRGFVPTSLQDVAASAKEGRSRRWGL